MIEFAKKTGDFSNLSPVDLKLLSLACTIEREVYGSTNHLRTEPKRNVSYISFESKDLQIEIHDLAKKVSKKKDSSQSSPSSQDSKSHTHPHHSSEATSHSNHQNSTNANDIKSSASTNELSSVSDAKEKIPSVINLSEKASNEIPKESSPSQTQIQTTNETKAEGDEEDEEGWITPENIEEVTEKLTKQKKSSFAKNKKKVGTITTDYAMQVIELLLTF